MAKYPEGHTETDPATGDVWRVQGGQWVKASSNGPAGRSGPVAAPEWGNGAVKLPDGSIVRYGPRGGMAVLKSGDGGGARDGNIDLTEGQSKDVNYASNAIDADSFLSEMEAAGYDPSLSKATGKLAQERARLYEQGKKGFANAVLRKETGATITPTEMEWVTSQYFPQPFDSAEVRRRKLLARKEWIDNLTRSTGGKLEQVNPEKVQRFKQTQTLSGMTPQQIETRKQFRGARGPIGTRQNPRIPRNDAELRSVPIGSFYIESGGKIVQKAAGSQAPQTQQPKSSGNGWKVIGVE